MPDATVFSIDVAVAKARSVRYYADPGLLQPQDQTPFVPPGVAFTNRTFRLRRCATAGSFGTTLSDPSASPPR